MTQQRVNLGPAANGSSEYLLNPANALTTQQMDALNQEVKAKKELEKKTWDVSMALAQFAAQALAASDNAKSLGESLIQASGQFLSQAAAQFVEGPLGVLLGGGVQHVFNRFGSDQELPIRDDALDVRVINLNEGPDYAAVRDKSEQQFARSQRERFNNWSMGAAAWRGA